MSSKRVLVVATSRGTRGGITAVVSAHERVSNGVNIIRDGLEHILIEVI